MVCFGTVAAFDEERGLGEIEADDSRRFPFHCTAIADGTRTISVGVRVCFEPTAGHRGRREARAVARIAPEPA